MPKNLLICLVNVPAQAPRGVGLDGLADAVADLAGQEVGGNSSEKPILLMVGKVRLHFPDVIRPKADWVMMVDPRTWNRADAAEGSPNAIVKVFIIGVVSPAKARGQALPTDAVDNLRRERRVAHQENALDISQGGRLFRFQIPKGPIDSPCTLRVRGNHNLRMAVTILDFLQSRNQFARYYGRVFFHARQFQETPRGRHGLRRRNPQLLVFGPHCLDCRTPVRLVWRLVRRLRSSVLRYRGTSDGPSQRRDDEVSTTAAQPWHTVAGEFTGNRGGQDRSTTTGTGGIPYNTAAVCYYHNRCHLIWPDALVPAPK